LRQAHTPRAWPDSPKGFKYRISSTRERMWELRVVTS
jgi:hypothetical protein